MAKGNVMVKVMIEVTVMVRVAVTLVEKVTVAVAGNDGGHAQHTGYSPAKCRRRSGGAPPNR